MPRPALTTAQINKAQRGRTDMDATPVSIRSRVELSPLVERRIHSSLRRRIGHAATLIERGTVRFEDINGPRGGIDTVCRIKLVLSGRPSVMTEERAADPQAAFELALPKVTRVLEKAREKHDLAVRKRHRGKGLAKGAPAKNERGSTDGRSAGASYQDPGEAAGSLIGRRVGRGTAALRRALERPEKVRRDAYLDTSALGVSESERKAGGGSTARRNTQAHRGKGKHVAALEDSRTKPSRKSTRRSATRTKQGTTQERTERGILYAPSSRTVADTARRSVPKRR